jgi:hypothetical protein
MTWVALARHAAQQRIVRPLRGNRECHMIDVTAGYQRVRVLPKFRAGALFFGAAYLVAVRF